MITEDYCSQEVLQLLREKGFPVGVGSWSRGFVWDGEGYAPGLVKHENSITHQMAMKWLREVHNLCIAPYAAAYRYGFTIDRCDTGSNICNDDVINEELTTYEEAVEAALKYSLENLI